MAEFSDNFNRANGGLGSNWASVANKGNLVIFSSGARAGTYASPFLYMNAVSSSVASFDGYQEASMSIAAINDFDFMGLGVRINPTNGTGYVVWGGTPLNNGGLYRITSASQTRLDNFLEFGNWQVGDQIVLRASASIISVYRTGSLIVSVTDTTYTSGQPAIYYEWGNTNASRLDDFSAKDITTTAVRTFSYGFIID